MASKLAVASSISEVPLFAVRGLLCWLAAFACASFSVAADVYTDGESLVINEVAVLSFPGEPSRLNTIVTRLAAFPDNVRFKAATIDGAVCVATTAGTQVITMGVNATNSAENPALFNQAERIANQLSSAFALPPLGSTLTEEFCGLGATISIPLLGRDAREAVFVSEPGGALVIGRERGSAQIKFSSPGNIKLIAKKGTESISWNIKVLPYAAAATDQLEAEVMGNPANSVTVAAAAAAAIQARMNKRDGVSVSIRNVSSTDLLGGETTVCTADVTASGPGYYPWIGRVSVKVRNIASRMSRAEKLWYSNEPENLYRPQTLFYGRLEAGVPARMLCHHRNRSIEPLSSVIMAVNTSDRPLKFSVISGDGGVNRNPTLAGLVAGDVFMRNWGTGSAVVLEVPAGKSVPIQVHAMKSGETSSSLLLFNLLSDSPDDALHILNEAVATDSLPNTWITASRSDVPFSLALPFSLSQTAMVLPSNASPTFSSPSKTPEFMYEVGGRQVFVRLGQDAITSDLTGELLRGNFGVTYDIHGVVKNPTERAKTVEMIFEASAGYTGAVFWLNREYVRIPLLQPKQQATIREIRLEPGHSHSIRLQTIPLSGSSYPATIIIREVGTE